jgi:hypothetical protein
MLTTLRRDRRNRRQASFHLEPLDDRLVLSAAAAGAMAEAASSKAAIIEHRHEVKVARHKAKLDRMEARHEAKLARMEARHEAKLARMHGVSMPSASMTPVMIGGSMANSTHASASASTSTPSTTLTPAVTTTSSSTGTNNSTSGSGTNSGPPSDPLSANVAAALQVLYQEYTSSNYDGGDSDDFTAPTDKLLQISGSSVAVSLKIGSGTDFNTALSQLQSDGMQVSASSTTYGLIEGMLPIGELPAVAQIAASVTPVSPPRLS